MANEAIRDFLFSTASRPPGWTSRYPNARTTGPKHERSPVNHTTASSSRLCHYTRTGESRLITEEAWLAVCRSPEAPSCLETSAQEEVSLPMESPDLELWRASHPLVAPTLPPRKWVPPQRRYLQQSPLDPPAKSLAEPAQSAPSLASPFAASAVW